MVEIRRLAPEEYEAAGRLAAQSFEPFTVGYDWAERYLAEVVDVAGRAALGIVLGAFVENRLIGTVTVFVDREPAYARMLAVDASARGAGAGRALMEAVLDTARTSGSREVALHTSTAMTTAQRIYDAMGFERTPAEDVTDGSLTLLAYRYRL